MNSRNVCLSLLILYFVTCADGCCFGEDILMRTKESQKCHTKQENPVLELSCMLSCVMTKYKLLDGGKVNIAKYRDFITKMDPNIIEAQFASLKPHTAPALIQSLNICEKKLPNWIKNAGKYYESQGFKTDYSKHPTCYPFVEVLDLCISAHMTVLCPAELKNAVHQAVGDKHCEMLMSHGNATIAYFDKA